MRKQMLFVFMCLLFSMPLFAADGGQEKPEREVFGNWFTLCAKSQGICTMNQIQHVEQAEGRSQQVLHAHISKNRKNNLMMQLILPLGITLQPGIVWKVDQGEEFNAPFHTCTPKGCIAVVPLKEKHMKLLRKGNEALIGFRPIGTDKTAVIKMSLKGFTKASSVVKKSARP